MQPHTFADVVVFSPAQASEDRPAFTYEVPEELTGRVVAGSLVVVPFGSRRLYGVVVTLRDRSPVSETRPVGSLVDPQPVLTPAQIALARWMGDEYLAPLHECLEILLPPGIVGHADLRIALRGEVPNGAAKTDAQARLLALLQRRGPLRGTQLDAALRGVDWRAASEQLARRNIVTRESFLAPPRAQPKRVETVRLIPDVDEETALAGLRSDEYTLILDLLHTEDRPLEVQRVYEATSCNRYHLNKLEERDLIAFGSTEAWRDSLADEVFVPTKPPPLTTDQQAVWETVRSAMDDSQHAVFLLHGVTGSGKTEIYLRAVAQALKQDRRAIILVPEISLTPQTVARFAGRFPDRVAVLHSALTDGERYDTWRRARAGLIDIVVGPRSALLAPLSPLGLIVLDEEHDDSYKQEAPRPRYHAREAALELARLYGATVILGSATPSLDAYYRAERGEFTLQEMPRRIMGHTRRLQELQARYHVTHSRYRSLDGAATEAHYLPLPPVRIVDLRAELRAGNRSIFSRALQYAMDEALTRSEQVILFLNRRGTATFVLCRDCGHVVRCPHCDVPLTYHGPRASLVCHHCNYREPQPRRCPSCGGKRIRFFGLGTERVEQTVRTRWPEARLLRWDRDTAQTHEAHTNILRRFADGAADVLVGTQMITKGLDLPLVTVVGVISADTALNLPDFRSGERTFQLLTQVAGRAGRGLLGGRVVIQTYHPDHYAVAAASKHDYEAFAEQELAFRRGQGYPPYSRLAKLTCEDRDYSRARARAQQLAQVLRDALASERLPVTALIGPAPPFFARLRGRYRWQILLRHPAPPAFLGNVHIPAGWRVDVDPVSVL
ncbi:MAG: primosomal protein N' [Anaerolineae bacterium]|jgi:primosomal protein N' (replication factor Y)